MARLVLDQVHKRFNGQEAVSDLSMTIDAGAFVALLGPSGCGKSTILRMLAGFETVSDGAIHHGDICLSSSQTHVPTEDRNFGMVFQSYALWPHMSVKDNVAYPLKVQRIPRAEQQKRIKEALEIVQLEAYADRLPAQLSGGQRQRVALARSLVTEPEVVLFDEPLANLDRHLRATMEETFRAFHQRTGSTMVYVTHDQSEAMSLADKIAVLDKGQLVQWDTPQGLYDTPRTPWLADFVGRGAIIMMQGVQPLQPVSGAEIEKQISVHSTLEPRQPVLVRPQAVHLHQQENTGLAAQVERCIYRGERYDLSLRLSNGQQLLTYSDSFLTTGQTVRVSIQHGWALESAK